MPINDWQFWVVTLVALGSIWGLKMVLMPRKKKSTKATLTVGGQPVGKKKGQVQKSESQGCGCG